MYFQNFSLIGNLKILNFFKIINIPIIQYDVFKICYGGFKYI
jgi:hypothetical protein